MARRGRIGARLAGACMAVAGFAISPAGATAARPRQMQISVTGALTYVWHGDRGAGCASEELCGIRGAIVFSTLQGGSLQSIRRGEKLALLFGTATARVRRDVGSGAPAECLNPTDQPLNLKIRHAAGRLEAVAAPFDLSGPCAGPLPGEVSTVALPATRTRDGGYAIRGTVPFEAGPFHGQVVSTLVLHPGRGGSGRSGAFTLGGGSSRGPGRTAKRLTEFVTLTYGLSVGPQSLNLRFSGDPGPFCEALDDCGSQGQLILRFPTSPPVLRLDADRRVRSRQTRREILRDFQRYPTAFSIGAFAGLPVQTAEIFSWPGGLTCRDAEPRSEGYGPLQLSLRRTPQRESAGGDTLRAVLSVTQEQGALRTNCPGPDFTNVSGPSVLASGELAVDGLLHDQQVLDLARSGSFATTGYLVRGSGPVKLQLSLRSALARTLSVR